MTEPTAGNRIRMTVAEARALGEAAMRGAGFDDEDARILTDHVLDAALCGYEYSGLPKLLNVVDCPSFRQPRHPVTVVRETGATALLDGGNTTGMIAAYRAPRRPSTRAGARDCRRVPRQHLDDRTQRLLLRNDRARRVRRDPHGGVPAGGGPVRRHAAGARHQPDRLRVSDRRRSAGHRHGDIGVHGNRSAVPRPARHANPGRRRARTGWPADHRRVMPRIRARCCRSAARRAATRASAWRWRWTRSAP